MGLLFMVQGVLRYSLGVKGSPCLVEYGGRLLVTGCLVMSDQKRGWAQGLPQVSLWQVV